jgi:SecD/SecF fusion protein
VDFTGCTRLQFDAVNNLEVAGMVENELGMRPTVITYGSDNKVRITTKYGIDSEDPEIEAKIEQLIYNGVKPVLGENVSYEQFRDENVQGLQKVGLPLPDIARFIYSLVYRVVFLIPLYRLHSETGVRSGAIASLT